MIKGFQMSISEAFSKYGVWPDDVSVESIEDENRLRSRRLLMEPSENGKSLKLTFLVTLRGPAVSLVEDAEAYWEDILKLQGLHSIFKRFGLQKASAIEA